MHPLSNLLLAISATMMFVGIIFMGTGTPVPLIDSQEEAEVEFVYSGQNTTLYFEQTETNTNNGWAIYSFGQYLDDDGDGDWDDCGIVQISLLNESGVSYFYPQCGNSTQREDVPDMIYVGQLCYNPSNEPSSRCTDGNYTFESNVYVKLSQEFQENSDTSIFSRILTGLLKACPPAGQFSAAPYPCYSSGSFLAYYFPIRKMRPRKRREKALLLNGVHTPFLVKREVAMASRRRSADTPRRRTSSGSPGKGTSEVAFTSQVASSSRGGPMQTPMLHTRKRSRIAVKSDESS